MAEESTPEADALATDAVRRVSRHKTVFFKVEATATIEEEWRVDVPTGLSGDELRDHLWESLGDSKRTKHAEFITDRVLGEETAREIKSVDDPEEVK